MFNFFFLFPITPQEVRSILIKISNKHSAGYDEIPCSLLIKVADHITNCLAMLINLSFQDGIFPALLKKALIVPIHKKGDISQIINYRGIALLLAFSKLYENAFHIRLSKFLETEKILSNNQFGFRSNLSTQDAILAVYKFILHNFEVKNKTVCILFDLKRAIDTVNIDLLLNKLYNYGIRGPALLWLSSYLQGRSQEVILKANNITFKSLPNDIQTGVPQGSVLGPLLFITFINDIFSYFPHSFVSLFADDALVAVSSDNINDLSTIANDVIHCMKNYCEYTGFILNDLKTDLILCSPRKLDESILIKVNSRSIKQSAQVKFLGLYMDSHLTWSSQIDIIFKKLSTSCFVLWQLRSYVTTDILITYYYACLLYIKLWYMLGQLYTS